MPDADDDDIWSEFGPDVFAGDEDFRIDFGRERTPEERIQHELYEAAALLAQDNVELSAGPRTEEGEGETL